MIELFEYVSSKSIPLASSCGGVSRRGHIFITLYVCTVRHCLRLNDAFSRHGKGFKVVRVSASVKGVKIEEEL